LVDLETINAGLYHPTFPKGWKRSQLYELANWTNGIAFKDINFDECGLPVIKISEIKNGLTDQTKYTKQYFDESVLVKTGDLLFSWSGQPETSIDASWWRGTQGWLNQHIFRVTVKDGIDESFFYYILKYLKPNFIGIARNKQTTGLGHVTKKDLARIEVAYPPLPEQRRIAHILGTLDDKIENNRKTAKTLEAMAQAIFKSWFVDFDPVRAKMAGESRESICKRLKITSEILDLFPDKLVDSELGKIPEGWEVRSLGEFVNAIKGRSYKSEELAASETALVTLKSFARGGGYQIDGLKPFTGTYKADQLLCGGDVLIACTDVTQDAEVIGRPIVIRETAKYRNLVASLDTIIVRPINNSLNPTYLYYLCATDAFISHTSTYTTGTTVLHLSKEAIPSFKFVLPSMNLISIFQIQMLPLLSKQSTSIESENDSLINIRDRILPKLVSGEIRLLDTEAISDRL